jgi:hypothetical protein
VQECDVNVWIRISSSMDVETDIDSSTATRIQINTGLKITVYATKEYAQKGQKQDGGIILEVDAACLADVEGEFGREALLTSGDCGEGSQPTSAYISVCYDGLPYRDVPNYGSYEPGTVEPQGDIAEFGPEADAWFKKFKEETGFDLHQ